MKMMIHRGVEEAQKHNTYQHCRASTDSCEFSRVCNISSLVLQPVMLKMKRQEPQCYTPYFKTALHKPVINTQNAASIFYAVC